MKKLGALLIVFSMLFTSSCTPELQDALVKVLTTTDELTTEEIGLGLKEALTQGISKGADQVSALDGYYKNPSIKILFPPEVKKVEAKLQELGLGQLSENLIEKINHAAEDAAKSAKPIFVSAIKQMTFQDALGILTGGQKDAATDYLKRTTSQQLYSSFNPVISNSLDKLKVPDAWNKVFNTYNKLQFNPDKRVNPDLNDYVTNKAMDGLFMMIAKEEGLIRKDPVARTTDLLKKVFAKQDNK